MTDPVPTPSRPRPQTSRTEPHHPVPAYGTTEPLRDGVNTLQTQTKPTPQPTPSPVRDP